MNEQTKEKVRKLLNGLVQDCQDMDKNLNFVNLTIDQAMFAIQELWPKMMGEEEISYALFYYTNLTGIQAKEVISALLGHISQKSERSVEVNKTMGEKQNIDDVLVKENPIMNINKTIPKIEMGGILELARLLEKLEDEGFLVCVDSAESIAKAILEKRG
jgi:hypothetical protein